MKAKDYLNVFDNPKILVYGPAGSGKTGLLSQFPNGLLLDFDQGMRTAVMLQDQFTPLRHNCEFETYLDSRSDTPTAWTKSKKRIFEISTMARKKTCPFDALLLDTYTGMCNAAKLAVMAAVGRPGQAPQLQDYKAIINEIEGVLEEIQFMPLPVIVSAHAEVYEDGSVNKSRPLSIGQKLASQLAARFDEVWYSECRKKGPQLIYEVNWEPSATRVTRTRSGKVQRLDHTKVGLKGLLEAVGYTYKEKK